MTVQRFIADNQADWDALRDLLVRLGSSGWRGVPRAEVRTYSRLYRKVVADLSFARMMAPQHPSVRQLEVLVGKCHGYFYRTVAPAGADWKQFFKRELPLLFRQTFPYTAAALAIFVVFGALGFFLTLADPGFSSLILPPPMLDSIHNHRMWTESINAVKPMATSSIATNNISVTFVTYALGITCGIGTVWLLAFNGLLIGVVLAETGRFGMMGSTLTFIAPHGVLELPAIFIAGAAGLMMGRAMLFPGRLPRVLEIQTAAHRGARLMLGCIPLLMVAGTIEGFVSPSHTPLAFRMTVAAVAASGLLAYLSLGWRLSPPTPAWDNGPL
ncbi:MAG: stage II sporulation protein M [Candidatus Xenobia bacterium]